MRIGMAQRALGEQRAGVDQFLDDRAIGVAVLALGRQDALAGEQRDVRMRTSRLPSTMLKASGCRRGIVRDSLRRIKLEVFFAMAGRGVHKAGAGVGGDMIAGSSGTSKS